MTAEITVAEKVFVGVLIIACVFAAAAGFLVFSGLAVGITLAGVLLGTSAILATQYQEAPGLWAISLVFFAVSVFAAPFFVTNFLDLSGFEAILVTIIFGIVLQLRRVLRATRIASEKADRSRLEP